MTIASEAHVWVSSGETPVWLMVMMIAPTAVAVVALLIVLRRNSKKHSTHKR